MWSYIKSLEFWLTLVALGLVGVLFYLLFFFVYLPWYTQHNVTVMVPEVTGMTYDQAIEKLDSADLRYEVMDSFYVVGIPPMTVLSQDPEGITKVKPQRKISLTLNKKQPPLVSLPDVMGVSMYQAKLRLESWNLKVGKIHTRPHDFKNLVLEAIYKGKKIEPGDNIPVGSQISLVVGQGRGTSRIAPVQLLGINYEQAISLLLELGLNINDVDFDPTAEEPPGTVIKQVPGETDSLFVGQGVTLFVSGPKPDEPIEGIKLAPDSVYNEEDQPR